MYIMGLIGLTMVTAEKVTLSCLPVQDRIGSLGLSYLMEGGNDFDGSNQTGHPA